MNAISPIAGPSIYIQAFYPGASAETVENTFLWTKRTMNEERTTETLEAKCRALEEELARTRAILAAAVEQAPAGIVIVDAPEIKSRLGNIAGHRIIRGSATPVRDIPLSEHLQQWTLLKANGTPYELLERPLAQAVFDHLDFPWVDQERLVKTNVALAIRGLKAVVSEGSTSGMLDT